MWRSLPRWSDRREERARDRRLDLLPKRYVGGHHAAVETPGKDLLPVATPSRRPAAVSRHLELSARPRKGIECETSNRPDAFEL